MLLEEISQIQTCVELYTRYSSGGFFLKVSVANHLKAMKS